MSWPRRVYSPNIIPTQHISILPTLNPKLNPFVPNFGKSPAAAEEVSSHVLPRCPAPGCRLVRHQGQCG